MRSRWSRSTTSSRSSCPGGSWSRMVLNDTLAGGQRRLARLLGVHARVRDGDGLPRDRGGRLRALGHGRAAPGGRDGGVRRRAGARSSPPGSGTRSPTPAARTSRWSSASRIRTTRPPSGGRRDARSPPGGRGAARPRRGGDGRGGGLGVPDPGDARLRGSDARPRQRPRRRRPHDLHQAQGRRARRGDAGRRRRRRPRRRPRPRRAPGCTWRPCCTPRSTSAARTCAASSTAIRPTRRRSARPTPSSPT